MSHDANAGARADTHARRRGPTMNPPTDDGALAAELTDVLARADPVPRRLLDAASAAFAWRDLDARLAALTSTETAAVRSTGPPRLLTFQVDDTTIDLQVIIDHGRVRLLGQVEPMAETTVEVRHSGGTWHAHTDTLGRFAAADLPPGPMRIRVHDGPAAVVTELFTT